jgi:glucose-6-phosphate isomerase
MADKKSESGLLKVDYNNLTAEALGEHGLSASDLAAVKESGTAALKDVLGRHRKGALPFLDLPSDLEMIKKCQKLADLGRKKYDDVVVLGIGGSALGATAVYTALRPLNYNRLPEKKRTWPRLTVADNIDPEGFQALLEVVDPQTTCFNVISKSGATAETMSQFLIVHELLRKKLGKRAIADHLLVTTDPANGVLRKIVQEDKLTALEIPPQVGGRFSVLTAVGLAPLAMTGVNIARLMKGAQAANDDSVKSFAGNKAAVLAALNWYLAAHKGLGTLAFMPYAQSLAMVADWFGQLWNESLGKAKKLDGSPNTVAQTAVKAVGVTDQHSQLQMYMEGPRDKTVMFLGTEKFRETISIPSVYAEYEELGYLGGRNLGELLNFELKGTARALAESGRPNLTLTVPEISAQTLGYLLMTLELATVISGSLYGVDPLDQPGVELGKKFTYGLLGRQGFESFLDRYQKGLADHKKYILS